MTDLMLDTSFFIDLRRRPHSGAIEIWSQIESGELTASVSPVAIYELWVGSGMGRDEEAFYQACFAFLDEAPLYRSAATQAGVWLRGFAERSEPLFRDALIAATAVERSERVLTRNVRDFALFPGVAVETY